MGRRGQRVKIARGVLRDDGGIAAFAYAGSLRRERRFPLGTPLREIYRWLAELGRPFERGQRVVGPDAGDVGLPVGSAGRAVARLGGGLRRGRSGGGLRPGRFGDGLRSARLDSVLPPGRSGDGLRSARLDSRVLFERAACGYRLAVAGFFRSTLDAIRRIPGVEHAAVASNVPVERGLNLPIHSPRPSGETPIVSVDWRYVTEEYFETLQIPLRQGRLLDARDTAGSQPVALVNETFANRLLDVERAVGSEVRIYEAVPEMQDVARTIVGVVGTVKTGGGLALPPQPTMFVPIEQAPARLLATAHSFIQANWLVRTAGSNPQLLATIEDTLGGVAGQISVSGLRTMDQVIGAEVTDERFRAVLLTIFALASLVLAAAGLYAR